MSSRWILGCLMAALMLVMASSVAYAAFIECSPDDAACRGTDQQDYIYGTDGPDLIYGLGGNDFLIPRNGQNTVFGNTGNDVISAGTGRDILRGNRGNDILRDWSRGNDVDQLFGGWEDDRLQSEDGDNLDTLDCGLGFDVVLRADPGDRIAENCEKVRRN